MNEVQRIQDQIRRSLDGDAWHGPSLMELLSEIRSETASARCISNAHTIWEIVLHLSASAELVLSWLRGEDRTLSPEEDWSSPPGGGDREAWQRDVDVLRNVHRNVLEELSGFDVSGLDSPILPGFSSVYVTLHGLVQHNLYHAGQIALLRKVVEADP